MPNEPTISIKISGDPAELTAALRQAMSGVEGLLDKITQDLNKFSGQSQKTSREVRDSNEAVKTSVDSMGRAFGGLEPVISRIQSLLLAGFGVYQIERLTSATVAYGMRLETLGVALEQIGKTAGYSMGVLNYYVDQVKSAGITSAEAISTVNKAIASGLPLERMKELATTARDIAVITQKNTSQAFADLMHGIESQQVEIFRTLGINIGLQDQIFEKYAKSLGKTKEQLKSVERAQAYLNAVLEQGAKYTGIAAAADETAGKQLASMDRYIKAVQEDLWNLFRPAVNESVRTLNAALKDLDRYLKENQVAVAALGIRVADMVGEFAKAIVGAARWGYENRELVKSLVELYAISKLVAIIESLAAAIMVLNTRLATTAALAAAIKAPLAAAVTAAGAAAGLGLYKTLKGEAGWADPTAPGAAPEAYGGFTPEEAGSKSMVKAPFPVAEGLAAQWLEKNRKEMADAGTAAQEDAAAMMKALQNAFTPSAKGGASKGGAETSVVSGWEEEWNRFAALADNWNKTAEELTAAEYKFWNEKLATVKKGSDEWYAVMAKLGNLWRTMSAEQQNELEKQAKQEQDVQRIRATAAVQHEEAMYDLRRENLQRQVELGQVSAKEALRIERQWLDERYRAQLADLQRRLELMKQDPTMDPAKLEEIYAKMRALTDKHWKDQSKIQTQSIQLQTRVWSQMFSAISSGFSSAVKGLIHGTMTWYQATMSVLGGLLDAFIDMVAKWVFEWIAGQVKAMFVSKTTAAAQVADQASVGAASAGASVAAIPGIGWTMVAAVAAATFATLMAFQVASAAGGWDIPAGVNPVAQLHAEEMVLPASIANPLRGMLAGGGGRGGGAMTMNIRAWDSKDVARAFRNPNSGLAKAFRRHVRDFRVRANDARR